MLEEILKSINTNLERMAKAQEEANLLYKNSIATEVSVGLDVGQTPDTNIAEAQDAKLPQTPILVPDPNAGTIQIPQLAQGGITPRPTVPQESIPQAIPTTQVVESFTMDQLAVAMSNAVNAGKMNIIQGILQQFGVQALTQINPADYNKVAILLKENGVEV